MSQTTRSEFEEWVQYTGYYNASSLGRNAVDEYRVATVQMAWEAYQAATEVAKATSVAPEQPKQFFENIEELMPLPDPDLIAYVPHGPNDAYSKVLIREYGAKCAEAARQPAPALPVKTWQEEAGERGVTAFDAVECMLREITDLRSALAETAAPVLNYADELSVPLYTDDDIIDACKEAGLGMQECNALVTILAATRSQP